MTFPMSCHQAAKRTMRSRRGKCSLGSPVDLSAAWPRLANRRSAASMTWQVCHASVGMGVWSFPQLFARRCLGIAFSSHPNEDPASESAPSAKAILLKAQTILLTHSSCHYLEAQDLLAMNPDGSRLSDLPCHCGIPLLQMVIQLGPGFLPSDRGEMERDAPCPQVPGGGQHVKVRASEAEGSTQYGNGSTGEGHHHGEMLGVQAEPEAALFRIQQEHASRKRLPAQRVNAESGEVFQRGNDSFKRTVQSVSVVYRDCPRSGEGKYKFKVHGGLPELPSMIFRSTLARRMRQ